MLYRFCSYIEKVFDFSSHLDTLRDSRIDGRIPTKAIWGTVFLLFLLRLRSLNATETQGCVLKRFEKIIGKEKPSADTNGRVLALMDPVQLRYYIKIISIQLKRNKVLTENYPYIFAVIDGHEFFSSRKIHCKSCCVRNITVKGEKVKEYYHRGVVLSIICQDLAIPLDVEMIKPGEGELTAARKLLERVFTKYPRYFDVIVGDALYANAPFFNFCHLHNKHVIAVLKNEERQLVKDALGISNSSPATVWEEKDKIIEYWDKDGFSHEDFNTPLRILHTIETKKETKKQKKLNMKSKEIVEPEINSWIWVSTIPISMVPTQVFWMFAHKRWDIENKVFHQLATYWNIDHSFKHDPKAILNFILTAFISFILIQSFYFRNLKIQVRRKLSLIAFALELLMSLADKGFSAPYLFSS